MSVTDDRPPDTAPKTPLAIPAIPGTLKLVNVVRMEMTLPIANVAEAYEVRRTFGEKGWTSGEMPQAGIFFPFEFEPLFDWRLMGARPFGYNKTMNGVTAPQKAVEYLGQVYDRREPPVTAKYSRPIVFYSRGAKAEDADDAKGGDPNATQFIRLITFVGNAPLWMYRAYARPEFQNDPRLLSRQ